MNYDWFCNVVCVCVGMHSLFTPKSDGTQMNELTTKGKIREAKKTWLSQVFRMLAAILTVILFLTTKSCIKRTAGAHRGDEISLASDEIIPLRLEWRSSTALCRKYVQFVGLLRGNEEVRTSCTLAWDATISFVQMNFTSVSAVFVFFSSSILWLSRHIKHDSVLVWCTMLQCYNDTHIILIFKMHRHSASCSWPGVRCQSRNYSVRQPPHQQHQRNEYET